jgi:hypothetical protein
VVRVPSVPGVPVGISARPFRNSVAVMDSVAATTFPSASVEVPVVGRVKVAVALTTSANGEAMLRQRFFRMPSET